MRDNEIFKNISAVMLAAGMYFEYENEIFLATSIGDLDPESDEIPVTVAGWSDKEIKYFDLLESVAIVRPEILPRVTVLCFHNYYEQSCGIPEAPSVYRVRLGRSDENYAFKIYGDDGYADTYRLANWDGISYGDTARYRLTFGSRGGVVRTSH